jgi:protoporphyrin/coproporphyrin ferrochelatase
MADDSKIGIFLMAHGAPDSVDHIPEYIRNIRGGKDPSPGIVDAISDHYRQIGGSSPLEPITRSQAEALEKLLNSSGGDRFRVYVGMRNWSPYIRDVVKQAYDDGVERLIGLCLAPQYSRFSTELYLKAFREAIRENGGDVQKADFIYSWADNEYLAEAFADRYKQAAKKIIASGETGFYTVFTVHSIPSSSLDEGDPYPEEFTRTVKAIIKNVKPIQWNQCYQSAGYIPVPWLEPSVEMMLDKISRFGKKAVLIVPVGFLCDHVEILYDIDIDYTKYAESKGLKLFRTESLNDTPKLIQALASVIWSHIC